MNDTINQQIDVLVLLLTPLLVAFTLCMPLVVTLIFKSEFLVILPMAICAVCYIFFRAIMLPVSYTSLAKGDSWVFLLMEILYDIVFGLLIWFFYSQFGLVGSGIALTIAAVYDLLSIIFVYGWRYGCKIRRSTLNLCVFQFVCLAATVVVCLQPVFWIKIAVGLVALIASVWRSWSLLKASSNLVGKMLHRFTHSSGDCCC